VDVGQRVAGRGGNNSGGLAALSTDMCPRAELQMRTRERLLHRLETGKYQPVKEYSRPAAGVTTRPQDIRTGETLKKTVEYLISKVFAQENEPQNVVFDFVFDRLRAVRQDLVLQNLEDATAASILAIIVRFHVLSIGLADVYGVDKFDPEINRAHLLECVKTLLLIQEKNNISGDEREEIGAIYILSNLSSDAPITWAYNLTNKNHPFSSSNSPTSLLAKSLKLAAHYRENNFVRYFRALASLPTASNSLLCLAAKPHSERLIGRTMLTCCVAYHHSAIASGFPVSRLAELLTVSVENVQLLCEKMGVACDGKMVQFRKAVAAKLSPEEAGTLAAGLIPIKPTQNKLSVLR